MDTSDDFTLSLVASQGSDHTNSEVTLLGILSNPLFLYQTAPYLPPSSLLALGATSKSFRDLIHHTPGVFRHLDLTNVKSVQFDIASIDHGGEVWRNVQLDENVTEDDFYGGPLRGVFGALRQRHILQDVQTLILDGLSVTAELISEIILNNDNIFNVRLLSIRQVKNLNERKLMQALQYAVRPSRPANTPRLQSLYVFGPKDNINSVFKSPLDNGRVSNPQPGARGVMSSQGAQIGAQLNQKSADELSILLAREGDNWYHHFGDVFPRRSLMGWSETLLACKDIINFDSILCTGPRHTSGQSQGKTDSLVPWYRSIGSYLPPTIATVAMKGCTLCHSAPEGMLFYGSTPNQSFPLLIPPPLHSSSVRAATRPITTNSQKTPRMLARCTDCLKGRYCESCHKWWCEDCYEITRTEQKPTVGTVSGSVVSSRKLAPSTDQKVYMGLCTEDCLVAVMMAGAGSNGMWG